MNEHKLMEMIQIQDTVNQEVNHNWKELDRKWYRASWVEAGELMAGLAYKWWKGDKIDVEQCRLEVIDILHFELSFLANNFMPDDLKNNVVPSIARKFDQFDYDKNIFDSKDRSEQEMERLRRYVDRFAAQAASNAEDRIFDLVPICEMMGLSMRRIYRTYCAKASLNKFRQRNGYKDGTYIKQWDGQEDNVFLESLYEEAPESEAEAWFLEKLTAKYEEVKKAA